MHITGMKIAGIPPFSEAVEFAFDEHVNVFIGPNASGKSTALRLLQARREIESRFHFELSDDWISQSQQEKSMRRRRGVVIDEGHKEGVDLVPWIYAPAVRMNLPLSFDISTMTKLQAAGVPVITIEDAIEESEGRFQPINLSNMLTNKIYDFDASIVHKAWALIMNRIKRGVARRDNDSMYEATASAAYQCAWSICSEVLMDGGIPTDYIHRHTAEGGVPVTAVHDKMEIQTTDGAGKGLFMGDLSAGTQGTLLWIWYTALKIADYYKNLSPFPYSSDDNWQGHPAILLIDEIENHLHPTWQRRVITALRDHFPNLQIFATTHSPFVVAGLKNGQVHLLNRDENGVVTYSPNTEDIVGRTADEILRTMMGVADPTDDETARYAAELRQLRDEGPRADEREEEERQKRMQELRLLVDRDLLAGGLKARRREEFANRFREAMESGQRDEELNQDNG